MTMRFARAALFACLMGTASAFVLTASTAPAFAAKASGPSVSAPVAKLLQPAQKLLEAKDYKGAMELIKQAQALPDLTEFDKYTVNNFLASAAIGAADYDTADTAYEAMADSPAMPDAEKQATLHNAMLLATQAKHYDKAIKYGTAYLALGGAPDPTVIGTLAQAYYFANDFTNAAAFAQKSLDATPPGQPPNRGALEIKLGALIKAKREAEAVATLETVVTYYNDPDDWGQIIDTSFAVKGIKDMEALHIYRLRLVVHASGQPSDYTLPANLCLAPSVSMPAEAVAFLDAGHVGGADLAKAQAAAARDRAVLPAFETLAKKSGADILLKLAETYYGYGRYADAEATARAALAKGGPKLDVAEANMLIGESLIKQGKVADAVAAFNAVSNPSPGYAKAQHLWLLYANSKYATASTATP
ncbi:MAG: tetratricopeptide repeat protein [Rhizomicrobium sp.]